MIIFTYQSFSFASILFSRACPSEPQRYDCGWSGREASPARQRQSAGSARPGTWRWQSSIPSSWLVRYCSLLSNKQLIQRRGRRHLQIWQLTRNGQQVNMRIGRIVCSCNFVADHPLKVDTILMGDRICSPMDTSASISAAWLLCKTENCNP